MKLKVREIDFIVKPKQIEGKLVLRFSDFKVKPKPRGVKIYKHSSTSVVKHDRHYGVKIQKQNKTTILKQTD